MAATIDLVGEKFDIPILDEFVTLWISLFIHSSLAKVEWKAKTGIAVKTYSITRWWSRWEVFHQVFLFFGDVLPFIYLFIYLLVSQPYRTSTNIPSCNYKFMTKI